MTDVIAEPAIEKTTPAGPGGAGWTGGGAPVKRARKDAAWVKWGLVGFVYLFLGVFLVLPVANVFWRAFENGWRGYVENFYVAVPADGDASVTDEARDRLKDVAEVASNNRAAVGMTLFTAAVAVPANTIFGVAVAWWLTRFKVRFRAFVVSVIDLPFSISPVVAGLVWVLIFGRQGLVLQGLERLDGRLAEHVSAVTRHVNAAHFSAAAGAAEATHWAAMSSGAKAMGWLGYLDGKVIFNWPGVVLATMFVTFPFVARELIPVMEATGSEEEMAAITLGAGGWQTFRRITLVNIKWGLLYGVILCNARAMGEFGAVNVVSGNVPGNNTTIPLRIEQLYQDYNLPGAFALATLLAGLAVVTLILKSWLERSAGGELSAVGSPLSGKGASKTVKAES